MTDQTVAGRTPPCSPVSLDLSNVSLLSFSAPSTPNNKLTDYDKSSPTLDYLFSTPMSGVSFGSITSPTRAPLDRTINITMVPPPPELFDEQDENTDQGNTAASLKRRLDDEHNEVHSKSKRLKSGKFDFCGFEGIERDEANYKYNRWKKPPVFMKKHGELDDEVQRMRVRETLQCEEFQETLFYKVVKQVWESGSNQWMKSVDFIESFGFDSKLNRYNNAVMFFHSESPYVTASRPQCFEARINLRLNKKRARELRVNPVFLQVMDSLANKQ